MVHYPIVIGLRRFGAALWYVHMVILVGGLSQNSPYFFMVPLDRGRLCPTSVAKGNDGTRTRSSCYNCRVTSLAPIMVQRKTAST